MIMTATVLHTRAPRNLSERAWALLTAFFSKIGAIYDRKDVAKRAGLSWHYFSA